VLKQLLIGALLASQTVLVAAAEPTPLQAWLKSRRMAVAKNWAQSETWDDICNAMRIDNRDCGLGTCIMGACTCDVGWSGPLCDDVDECYQWSPCQNGGSCFQSADVVAGHRVLGTNKFVCACSAGFDGRRCQCRECGPHGVCQDDGTCSCRYGWSGVGCLLAPDPCMWPVRVHCGAHGKCISSHPQSSHCQCTGGFSGVACDQSPDACLHPAIVVCGMHGSCVDGACICTDGYRGPRCMVAPPPKKPAYDGSAVKAAAAQKRQAEIASVEHRHEQSRQRAEVKRGRSWPPALSNSRPPPRPAPPTPVMLPVNWGGDGKKRGSADRGVKGFF
jgi:hypothetical protein